MHLNSTVTIGDESVSCLQVKTCSAQSAQFLRNASVANVSR
jgi:hypothetical protein